MGQIHPFCGQILPTRRPGINALVAEGDENVTSMLNVILPFGLMRLHPVPPPRCRHRRKHPMLKIEKHCYQQYRNNIANRSTVYRRFPDK